MSPIKKFSLSRVWSRNRKPDVAIRSVSAPIEKSFPFEHPTYAIDDITGEIHLKSTGKKLSDNEVFNHGEQALDVIVKHVQNTMKDKLGFIETFLPNAQAEAKCNVFLTGDYCTSRKLLVFVTSSRGLEPGIWSRSLVLRSGLNTGSMLPYFQKALDDGFGIIVTNPNANYVMSMDSDGNPIKVPILHSKTQEEHLEYIWDTFVTPAAAKRVYIIGYGNGGVLVKHLLQERGEQLLRRTGAIALIESSHKLSAQDKQHVKSILAYRSMHWESADQNAQSEIPGTFETIGCSTLSAGRQRSNSNAAYTISAVMNYVFEFLAVRDTSAYMESITANQLSSSAILGSPTMNEKSCLICDFQYTLFDRRHHCRMCHRAVCNSCSPDRLFLPGSSTAQRVCTECATDGATALDLSANSSRSTNHSIMTVDDFDLLKVIGKGAFGKVMLVRKKGDSKDSIYAMKVLKKASVFAKNQVEHTKSERRILRDIDHPFVVRLRYAFQSEDKLYLVMDYYNGGSLFFHLRKARKFSENRARFYAAQLLLAMSHLHELNIAYRDLKLENILMDSNGYVALTDFGLSKENVDMPDGAKTFCGTAEYIAPELLRGLPYGKAVDWWGFGTLLYEMLTGQTPFFDRNRKRMFHNILHRDILFPASFSENSKDLLLKLLRRDPSKRLGSAGVQEIMEHPFFSNVDWGKMARKTEKAPFVPNVAGLADTTNIANVFTREIPRDSPVTTQLGETHREQAHFEGFTYVPGSELER